jgi:hypothetical protein
MAKLRLAADILILKEAKAEREKPNSVPVQETVISRRSRYNLVCAPAFAALFELCHRYVLVAC